MTKYFLIFATAVSVGCADGGSSKKDGIPNPDPDDSEKAVACTTVEPADLLQNIDGIWVPYDADRSERVCTPHTGDNLATTYIYFNTSRGTHGSYLRVYAGTNEGSYQCRRGTFDSGGRVVELERHEVRYCQTKELVESMGEDVFFIRTSDDQFRLVSSVVTDLGEVLLLLGDQATDQPRFGPGITLEPYKNN